jgi:hypothetical protein
MIGMGPIKMIPPALPRVEFAAEPRNTSKVPMNIAAKANKNRMLNHPNW